MKLAFELIAWEQYQYWQTADKTVFKKLNRLIEDCLRTPLTGIGKPEPLKYELKDCWSRRITGQHRLAYTIQDDSLIAALCRFNYDA